MIGNGPPKGFLLRLLDLFSSVWTGVGLVALILLYCAVGSAFPDPAEVLGYRSFNVPHLLRQRFELTEMEWFSWWPFQLLVGLLIVSLITVTLRRIPLRPLHYGVWMIHAGMVTLCLGSVLYFARKIEGDVAVYRRSAVIRLPGQAEPLRMTIRPGESVTVPAPQGPGGGANVYRIQVADINPSYRLLSGPHQGEVTYAVYLDVQSPRQRFTRQLLAGFPEQTEDFRPGQGRTQGLLDPELDIQLDYAPADEFYLANTAAVYLRRLVLERSEGVGQEEWTQLPVPGLPRYYEYLSSPSEVWSHAGTPAPPVRPLDIRLHPSESGVKLPGELSVRVSGFLPFARLERRWVPGGGTHNPVLGLAIQSGGRQHRFEMLARDPRRSLLESANFPIHFVWAADGQELASLTAPRKPRLAVSVPAGEVNLEVPLSELMAAGEYAIAGTDYTLRFVRAMPWTMASQERRGQRAYLFMVQIATPRRSFSRALVHPFAELTQDIDADGHRAGGLIDEGIQLKLLDPAMPGLTIVAGPPEVGLHAVLRRDDGSVETEEPRMGQPLKIVERSAFGGPVTVEYLYPEAVLREKPQIIPPEQRDTKAGAGYSMVRLELAAGTWTDSLWLTYSHYTHPGRMPYEPRRVTLPDGTAVELLYGRQKRPLPAPVALEEFQLRTYPGGMRERDYISLVRFQQGGGWTPPRQVRSNNPTAFADLWFFQSTWDPPDGSRDYAGMNYTGLGVGNREGVRAMLAGTVLAIAGMIYAFYVKPVLRRRRRRAVLAKRGGEGVLAAAPVDEPVGV